VCKTVRVAERRVYVEVRPSIEDIPRIIGKIRKRLLSYSVG
jgi:hypothetical protein